MPDLRGATDEEIAEALPGVDEGTDLVGAPSEDDSGSDEPDESSADSSSSSSDDSSTVVTVTGDPGSEEGQTVVGTGDTIRESEVDAATNYNFDADEGTDIDDIEEDLGTDQPEANPDDSSSSSTSVVVTQNEQGQQETVSVAQTQEGALNQAAANQNFDAAEQTNIDLREEAIGVGQGDGTTAQDLRENLPEETDSRPDNVFERNIQKAQVIQAQLSDKSRSYAQASNPNVPVVENVVDVGRTIAFEGKDVVQGNNARQSFRDIENSFLIEGQGIINQGQRYADKQSRGIKKNDIEVITPAGQPVENLGRAADFAGFDRVGNKLQNTGEKIDRGVVSGATTFGTGAGGVAVQAPGAAPKLLRGTLQTRAGQGAAGAAAATTLPGGNIVNVDDLVESGSSKVFDGDGSKAARPVQTVVGGAKLTKKEFNEDPIKFVSREGGEEVIETAAGFALGGVTGAAAAAGTITPSPSIDVKTSVKNAATSVKEAVTDPNAAGSLAGGFVPEENPSPSNDPRPGKGNTVRLQDIDTTGVDLQAETETSSDTTSADTSIDDVDNTGTDFESDISVDSEPSSTVETGSQGLPDTVSDLESIAEGRPESDTVSVPENIAEGRPETTTDVKSTPEGIPETVIEAIPETRTETEPETVIPEITQETTTTPSITPDDGGEDRQKNTENDDDDNNGLIGEYAASLDALVFGITGNNQNVQNPLKTRPIQKDVESTLDKLEKELRR